MHDAVQMLFRGQNILGYRPYGDPFKDTAGPAINILIKLLSMVSIVFAGLIVNYAIL